MRPLHIHPRKHKNLLPILAWAGASLAGAMLVSTGLWAATTERRVTIGNYGKLEGIASGWAWVFASEGATISAPKPCNEKGCFKDTHGKLCTNGTIRPLTCTNQGTPQVQCNWDKNWGMVMGFNTTHPAGPWGSQAPSQLAVEYSSVPLGGSAGHFRLNVHVVGDPYAKQYCIDNYTPGAFVQPSDFKTECWFGTGASLRDFSQIDTVGLLRVSEHVPVNFDFCITGVVTK